MAEKMRMTPTERRGVAFRALAHDVAAYTAEETLDALVSEGVVGLGDMDRGTAVGYLNRLAFKRLPFRDADGSTCGLADLGQKRLDSVGARLAALWPEGKALPAMATGTVAVPPTPSLTSPPQSTSLTTSATGAAAEEKPSPSFAHMTVPADCCHPFERQYVDKRTGRVTTQMRLRVTLPEGTVVGGTDISGGTVFANCSQRAARQLDRDLPVVVTLRADRKVWLRGIDGIGAVDAWDLARAVKASRWREGQDLATDAPAPTPAAAVRTDRRGR